MILTIENLRSRDEAQQVDYIGENLDKAFDEGKVPFLEHLLVLAENIVTELESEKLITRVFYNVSNGYSYIRKLSRAGKKDDWQFDQEILFKEVFYLRKAIQSVGFSEVERERQCQIYTNLGNTFSYIGRFVDALEMYDCALQIIQGFPMAIGNKGYSLFYYARATHNEDHRAILLHKARTYLLHALNFPTLLEGDAEKGFTELLDNIEKILSDEFKKSTLTLDDFKLSSYEPARNYQLWCLRHRLYINPINDLGAHTIASHDVLNLHSLMVKIKDPPIIIDYINLIKQEYSSARYFLFQYDSGEEDSIPDRDLVLLDTNQYLLFSHRAELLKYSLRGLYSILDKIAFTINKYWNLEIPDSKVTFRTIWFEKDRRTLKPFFKDSDNWALRGLFWLSRDFFEKQDDFQSVLEPQAKELALIRNFVEHKSLKVKRNGPTPEFRLYESEDKSSYSITASDLQKKVLKLSKLVRSAIIYLIYSIDYAESTISKNESAPIILSRKM
ncbi:MAG: hypothetical protein DWQ02_17830 [Bacteroidetes bacterium]|nr:MAG: hypothetical protein DWQ02_17830 [Bacteroidota bacterium]